MTWLEFRKVSKFYRGVLGLNRLDLLLDGPGRVIGLVGPNGAGKSTFLRLSAGVMLPDLGEVYALGYQVGRNAEIKGRIGYVPEVQDFAPGFRADRFLRLLAELGGLSPRKARRRARECLGLVGLGEGKFRLASGSRGMRQRVKVAQALLAEPELLLLDEPLQGIDPEGRKQLKELFLKLAGQGRLVILSSHILEEVEEIAEEVVFLWRGECVGVGTRWEVRRSLRERPLVAGIRAEKAREVASELCRWQEVKRVEIGQEEVKVSFSGEGFLNRFAQAFGQASPRIESFEILDQSLPAIFRYLAREEK